MSVLRQEVHLWHDTSQDVDGKNLAERIMERVGEREIVSLSLLPDGRPEGVVIALVVRFPKVGS